MTKYALALLGASMTICGTVFALQGFGYVEGSPMTNTNTWAILGPIIAASGVLVLIAAVRRR
ncbi:MAG: hypothetical protein ABIR57_04510 [Aeromicrobium sp.]